MGHRQSAVEDLVVMFSACYWSDCDVFVTGHTGFKGAWLSVLLAELDARVWGYALPPYGEKSLFGDVQLGDTMHHHQIGDIRDVEPLRDAMIASGASVVFHLAAQSLVRASYDDPLTNWSSNVMGTVNVLEAARQAQKALNRAITVVAITTDKVYHNNEWPFAYRETDRLGGKDPYSASKAACELAIASFRSSFATANGVRVVSARAGNVIGGGDWAKDRIVPDMVRALSKGHSIEVRNPNAVRPWQHVLDPLVGYMTLAQELASADVDQIDRFHAFNFGPDSTGLCNVRDLVDSCLSHWPGKWTDISKQQADAPAEATLLSLTIDKARQQLNWTPVWGLDQAIAATFDWYKRAHEGAAPIDLCREQIHAFLGTAS